VRGPRTALAARRRVDELGAQTVSTVSTCAARMLRPDPATPIERPPTVEDVLDEIRVA